MPAVRESMTKGTTKSLKPFKKRSPNQATESIFSPQAQPKRPPRRAPKAMAMVKKLWEKRKSLVLEDMDDSYQDLLYLSKYGKVRENFP